jgi:heme/copper-type cytochrome/quinol oxidase subunit 4
MSDAVRIPPVEPAAQEVLGRIQRRSLLIGAAGAVALIIGAVTNREQFFRSYLVGYMLWVGVTLGCLAILMLQHLTGGRWGLAIRRTMEAGSRNVKLMALLFVPVLLGMKQLYPWVDPGSDPILQHKAVYMNPSMFVARAIFYFVVWGMLAWLLSRWSGQQEQEAGRDLRIRLRGWSAAGLLLYAFTVTLASIDWVMSLDPHWSSTIYGMLFMAGQCLSALCVAIGMVALLGRYPPLSEAVHPEVFHDLGKLVLTFVILWAYFSYSQLLIIWSGNLPDEISWYLNRWSGGWEVVGFALVAFHFALPFALLLSRDLKRAARKLALLAGIILVMRAVDLFWLIEPNFAANHAHLHPSWMDLVAPIALGGLWMAAFLRELKQRPVLPLHDPELASLTASEHAAD